MSLTRNALWVVLAAAPAWAGKIHGTVHFTGTPPVAATLRVTRDQTVCGDTEPDESLLVDAKGLVRNAVVFVENAPKTPLRVMLKDPQLDQVSCRYVPHVQAVRVGTKLVSVNSDAALHTVHGTLDGKTLFNQAQPLKGMKTPSAINAPGLIHIGCDAGHTWMSAWVYAFDHGFFAVTNESGAFEISGLPPGNYTLVAWQEKLGTRKQTLQVGKDGDAEVRFTFPAKP